MRSTDSPDDDSQQGPDSIDARPRADRSAVANLYVADLEPASLREREREKLQGQAAEERCQTCLKHESGERVRKLHRGRSTKTAAFSRKTELSNKQRKVNTDPHSAERLASTIQNSGSLPCAMQE